MSKTDSLERLEEVKSTFLLTNDFLMNGNCNGCKTVITRHNSILEDGIRYCVCCGHKQPNGWLTSSKTLRGSC